MEHLLWIKSPHRFLYLKIALKHRTMPSHVYDLAHGGYQYPTDRKIIEDMVKVGLLKKME